ncbi:SRPBCC family protein [Inquilinus sp. Marseille-Q2685]|uniref:SRPBCC family protein n=1 Tax=Inquilinus sp. Marseille-Q2685 TaxID=2866581 RepID=UPI001CE43375|nr:SRPBCC family protein [Inquilinus sp. Marseille-Q2685]
MIRVTTSSVINAPVETVWQAIRDFNALPDWHPAIASSKVEDGGSPDRIGCVRSMELAGGGTVRERLLTLSDSEHSVTYAILAAPMPVENYVATLRLLPVTDGNRSFAEWTAEFDVAAENEAAMRKLIGQGVFQTGFDSLKQRFGG